MTERTWIGRRTAVIEGGRIVTPGRVVRRGAVVLRGREIQELRTAAKPDHDERIDATGRLVLPGLVDLHGDDVEPLMEPRPGATVDPDVALTVGDRLNLAAGVTTKFNAVAFEESPVENRSIRRANEVLDAVDRSGRLLADHRVHARCALTDASAVDAVVDVLDHPAIDLVSLMNHVPGIGQFADQDAFEREYVADGHWTRPRLGGSPEPASRSIRGRLTNGSTAWLVGPARPAFPSPRTTTRTPTRSSCWQSGASG